MAAARPEAPGTRRDWLPRGSPGGALIRDPEDGRVSGDGPRARPAWPEHGPRSRPAPAAPGGALGLRGGLLVLVCLALASPAGAQVPSRKIGEMELSLLGVSATVDPVSPVVPKNVASGVRIVVRAGAGELSAADVARFVGAGYEVQAELAGPGLRETLTLPQHAPGEPAPSDPLLLALPPLPIAGDYSLTNVRIVAGGRSVLDVAPQTVTIQVIDQILVTSVKTRALTLAEIREKGIVLDSDDYLGFEFTLGLKLESKAINLSFPVVFDRQGISVPQPILPPPTPWRTGIQLPPLPTIVPLLLEAGGGGQGPRVPITLPSGQPVRIPSVLVIPGNVGYLKQFFSAQLFVANGAPVGSGLVVRDITGRIKLPPGADRELGTADDPLALPETVKGPQPETLPIRGVGPDGVPDSGDDAAALSPAEQGQAEFLVRGEKEGFHPIDFDIAAMLEGLPVGPVSVTGKASGGVLVRNPYFDVTFTVPGVVRKGEPFKFFVTVTNIGQGLANDLHVTLDAARMAGAKLLGEGTQRIETLKPGDARTLQYLFEGQRTGQVVASYLHLDTQDGSTGNLKFTLGVGERGVPLSPDTLVLPAAVDALPPSVVDAAMRVLGQAWSIANAPSGTLPRGVARTSKVVVTEKALALAEAGLRVTLGQAAADAIRDVAFDFYGGGTLDLGFDQLLRQTEAGRSLALALGAELAEAASFAGGALLYERALAQLAASGPDFMTFAVASGSTGAPVDVVLGDGAGRQTLSGGSEIPRSEVLGAALIPLGNPSSAPVLGIVTAPSSSPYALELRGRATGFVDVSVTLPRGDGTFLRGVVTSVGVGEGSRARIVLDLSRPSVLVVEQDASGDGVYEDRRSLGGETLSPQGPQLVSANVIGPETLSGASPFGIYAAFLFDRVVDAAGAAVKTHYQIPSNAVQAAKRQLSGRLVFAALQQPEGPYVPTTLTVGGIPDTRGAVGPGATLPLGSRLLDPGAVVTGRVITAEGTPVASGVVTYMNNKNLSCWLRADGPFAAVSLDSGGQYELRYVRQDQCGYPFTLLTQDPATGALRQVSSYVRTAGQRIVLDIALFGRGSVTGVVRDLSGLGVPDARVVAVSGTDPQVGGAAATDGDGRYTIPGITVGPVSVTAAKGASLGRSSGRIDRAGTTAVIDLTLDGGSVRVSGSVRKVEAGVASAVPGVYVLYSVAVTDSQGTLTGWVPVGARSADGAGRYVFEAMPVGQFKLEAAINTRDRGQASGIAAAGDDIQKDVVIEIKPDASYGTVRGVVRFPDGTGAGGVIVGIADRAVLSSGEGLALGTFEISGVTVRPYQSQTVYARTRDGLRKASSAVMIGEPGQVVSGVVLTLSGLGAAEFTVLDPEGKPVADQEVALLGSCLNPCGCSTSKTGADGRVRFPGLSLGSHGAQAIRTGVGFVDVARATVSVPRDGETGFGVIRFNGAGIVSGSVLNPDASPAFGADVALVSSVFVNGGYGSGTCGLVQKVSHSARTGQSGQFRFTGVNVGSVGATATHPFFPTSVGKQGTLLASGQQLSFTLKLVNTISGELSGTVFLPDGTTPAGAGVEVTANGPLPDVTVTTSEAGRYRFAKIFPQGSYKVTVRDPVTGGLAQERIYLQAGQDVVHDLRLEGRGTVRVRVVDGADQPVESAFVRLTEIDFPARVYEGAVEPANQGVVTFEGVFEGKLSADASDALGRGGRASSVLPKPGDEVEVKVRLTVTGTVKGRFLMPGGTTPIPFGVVKLLVGARTIGQTTTQGAGEVGAFSFDYVPAGAVRLEAQDPLTARTGLAVGTIDGEGQVLTLDVLAQSLGSVEGQVTSNGVAEPGARVDIVSGNLKAVTFADSRGHYFVDGIPEGRVVVTASLAAGFLAGTASASLAGEGTALTLDVPLRASGDVTGQVLKADGVTAGPVSIVSLQVGGLGGGTQSTVTDTGGRFQFERVPAGLATLSADVVGGIDQAKKTAEVLAADTVEVAIPLNGVGSIRGRALDSAGNPIAGDLWLSGTGAFRYSFFFSLGSQGTFQLPEVLAGPVTASLRAKSGEFYLYGTASATVAPEEEATLDVQVQPSGTVTGVALRSNGTTPAFGAQVTLQLQVGGGSVSVQAQSDGSFTLSGVPLGAFTLRATDPLTTGVALVLGRRLDTNGETVDVGSVVLDDSPIAVVSVEPADGASGVGVAEPVRVVFSDPVTYATGVSVKDGASVVVSPAQVSADGLAVTLSGRTWPDSKDLTVTVSTSLTDVYGRHPAQPFTSRFRTVDLSPPKVVSIQPASGTIQVDPGTAVVATFSEPLAPTTDLATLVVLSGPGAGPGTAVPTSPTVVTFTPGAPLATNATYTVVVNGAVDLTGNRQTVAFSSSFKTPDTLPPTLVLSNPSAGSWVRTARPSISVLLSDPVSGVDMTTSTMALDGAPVTPLRGSASMSFPPPADLAQGPHTVQASVADRAGNVGTLSASFSVDTVAPEAAVVTGVSEGQVLAGTLSLGGGASDAGSGLARVELLRDGGLFFTVTPPSFAASYNTSGLTEGPHTLTARGVDVAGNVGPEGPPVHVVVDNRVVSVTITSPAANARFRDSVLVKATVGEVVERVEFSVGAATMIDAVAPYEATLDLASAPEGPAVVSAKAVDTTGETALATRTIVVDRTPPAAPDASRIDAEPPDAGFSLVFGRAGAVEADAKVDVTAVKNGALVTATAEPDGSFSASVAAASDDTLSLVAVDVVGNRSAATQIVVRRTPSLPPAEGTTALRFEGVLADRVGPGAAQLAADGSPDAVFSMDFAVGQDVTRQLSFIDLVGSSTTTRSTRPAVGSVLGVAGDAGAPFLNGPDGAVGFPITSEAQLTLYAADLGFIRPGATYTVTAGFTDGSRFVGTFTIVAPEDQTQVAHSARIAASPATVQVAAGAPGTAVLTLSDIRDIEGTLVPDGTRVAIAVADMASKDPRGTAIRSAGGTILDGDLAANNASFRVFTLVGGSVTATYSTAPVTPAARTGATAVVQVLPADAGGNVLGTEAISTLDLLLRAAADPAIVTLGPSSLYADKADRRSHVRIDVRDATLTKVLVSAARCASVNPSGVCIESAGGQILGGATSPTGAQFRAFDVVNGAVECDYSSSGLAVPVGQVQTAVVQVVPANSTGTRTSTAALGTASLALAGAAGAEIRLSAESVPLAFPLRPVQVVVHHVHDARANLVPDGAKLLLAVSRCATVNPSLCVESAGGTLEGTASPTGIGFKVFSLALGELATTYTAEGVTATPGQVKTANVQVAAADPAGARLYTTAVAVKPLTITAPTNAVGSADPPSLLADGGLHTSTVTFKPILDSYGNPLPDGSKVLASAANCAGYASSQCIASAGGQILNEGAGTSPSGAQFKVLTVAGTPAGRPWEGGTVAVTYGDQNLQSGPGQVQTANVVLLESGANGERLSTVALGAVAVSLAGLTSAQGAASPAALHADGGDQRSVVTLTNLLDAAGQRAPDGTQVAISANNYASTVSGSYVVSAGGQILGGTTSPTLAAHYRLFPVVNGQVVLEYSAQGVAVDTGEKTAVVQVLTVTPAGGSISLTAVATVPVRLLSPGSATVATSPGDFLADGGARLAQVTIGQLLESDGTPVPDGSRVGLTVAHQAATTPDGCCYVASAGGELLSAGTTPGDGTTASNYTYYRIFTVAGGEVRAVYSAQGLTAGFGETKTVRVAVVPAGPTGLVLSTRAFAVGTISLRGTTSATASGPESLPLGGVSGTVTFSGIKDSAGNTVPDGTLVVATAGDAVTVDPQTGGSVASAGGTIEGGGVSPTAPLYRVFTVTGGSVSVTYSTAGASAGVARVQLAPAASDGAFIGSQSLLGGIWAITVQ